ncbi:MAG: ABC transporter permease subunit, partial [Lentisphaerae bacterium]|nr:ABC transporter permease subunit [Lentisphaerota bacterium]
MKRIASTLGKLVLTFAGFYAVVFLFGHFLAPDIPDVKREYSEELLHETERLREVKIDDEHLIVLQQDVDYEIGENAAWYPKGQSPILAELEEEGKIPPVTERIGSEPLVLKGVDGIGEYGGTWMRVANSPGDIGVVGWRLSGVTLVRWSPMGYPIRPHLAKSWEVSDDKRTWTFHLRRGIRWSDGHPFTSADIEYWWKYDTCYFGSTPPFWMVSGGEVGDVVAVDDYTVEFRFPNPHGTFLEMVAFNASPYSPKHYLGPYHPEIGDRELIEAAMNVKGYSSERSLYFSLRGTRNPEHPRMWPWIYRTYKANPPEMFVRNPYFWAVDEEGNQLPYIDRLLFEVRNPKLIPISATSGAISMQTRHMRYEDYTLLMENRDNGGYEVYHWFGASRSIFALWPNINRRVFPDNKESKWKSEFLGKKQFRQALSIAIDRQEIIDAVYAGVGEPAQIAPGRESPYHSEKLLKSYTQFDPATANRIFDEIGLDGRDSEGMRTFPDGSRMTWYIDFTDFTGEGPVQFIVDDWAKVGIRAIQRERSRPLFNTEKVGLMHDFTVWTGESEFNPIVEPRSFVATEAESHFAPAYGMWYRLFGLYADDPSSVGGSEPPLDSDIRKGQLLLEKAYSASSEEERIEIFQEILDIAAENVWSISIATPPPRLVVVKDGFRNVPRTAIAGNNYSTPANAGIETYYFESPADSEGAIARIKEEMITITPAPDTLDPATMTVKDDGSSLGKLFTRLLGILVVAFFVYAGIRHPFIGKRLLIMIPTLLIISIATFIIIQAPPGDFIQTKILQLQLSGDTAAIEETMRLRETFHLDKPMVERYMIWMGIPWFTSFSQADKGLLQGDFGRSMETQRSVNEIVGARIELTIIVSIGTSLFTSAVAFPIGIYSAVKRYTIGDYVLTFLGFLGMCIPNFLFAILLMYWSGKYFCINVSGLFSPEFAATPEWSLAKVLDLLKHMWVPIVVIAVAGTASMIRTMRGNLIDELSKPYVTTAMAKGVPPFKLLMKYPVRLALNPFISGIGGLFPSIVSGGSIVAIVLSLPMVGPLLLDGLMTEDVYLAGSMLMVLSLLGMVGTLVSDLLLLWLDPRIRMEGGAK